MFMKFEKTIFSKVQAAFALSKTGKTPNSKVQSDDYTFENHNVTFILLYHESFLR